MAILRSIIPLYIVMSLSQFLPPMLTVIVDEKEKKIKESMRMVGLRDSVFWEVGFSGTFRTFNYTAGKPATHQLCVFCPHKGTSADGRCSCMYVNLCLIHES